MGIIWQECLEGSICFFLRWPKLLWVDIRYYQKQWQVIPWPSFIRPQTVARDDNVDAKESGKLSKVIRRGYVRVVEVKSLNH